MAEDNFLLKIKGEFEDHISDALQGLTSSSIPGLVAGLTALAGAFAVEKMSEFVREAINAGDELGKLAQKTGVAVDAISEWQLAGALGDASTETMAMGFKKLSKAMVEAQDSSSNQAKIFNELGIAIRDSEGNLRSAGDVMKDLADAFANAPDDANKVTVAMALLGKAGTDLIPTLNGGKQAVEELSKVNRDLGLSWSEESTKQAETFNDSLTLVGKAVDGLWQNIAKELLPILSTMAEYFAESVKEGGILRDFFDGFATMLTSAVIPVLKFLADTVAFVAAAFHIAGYAAAGFVAAAERVAQLDFSGAAEVMRAMTGDIQRTVSDYENFSAKLDDPEKGTKGPEGIKKSLQGAAAATITATDEAKKLTDEYAKAHTEMMKTLFQITAGGKTAEVAWNIANGEFAKFSDVQKATLLDLAREIDLQTQLEEIYKKKGEWFDSYTQKVQQARDKVIEGQVADPFAREGAVTADAHVAEVNKWAQAEMEKVKGYEAEAKAIAMKNIAETVANETSEQTLQVYKDIGEQVAHLNQQAEVWANAVGKNKDATAKLNNELEILDKLLKEGKITQTEYVGAVEKNSKAQLDLWASQTEANARFKALVLDDRINLENLKKSQEELKTALDNGTISAAEYQYKLKGVNDQIRNIDPVYTTDMLGKMNDQMRSAAASFEGMFSDYLFQGMQGKWQNLGDMVKQIIDRMVANMLAAQIQMALFGDFGSTPAGKTPNSTGVIGSLLGSISGLFRAEGGPVTAGQAYIVGENRPELFVPSSNGTIIPSVPNSNSVNFHINAMDGQDVMRTLANKQREIAEMVFSTGQKYNLAGAR